MNISNSILEKESPQVREMFTFWAKRMHCEVDFWPLEDDIDVHTEGHCERVLLHALRLANMQKLRIRATIALCHTAIFHDTRRKDNYLDKGHGERAAEYYKAFCAEHADMHYLPEAYAAIRFHDQDDTLGDAYIQNEGKDEAPAWLTVYHDFKDADALDRYRLGTWCLDANYLRSQEAKEMMPFALDLVHQTIDAETLKRTYALTEPFKDRFKKP